MNKQKFTVILACEIYDNAANVFRVRAASWVHAIEAVIEGINKENPKDPPLDRTHCDIVAVFRGWPHNYHSDLS